MKKSEKFFLIEQLSIKSEWVWKETLKIHRLSPETRVASSLSPIEIFVDKIQLIRNGLIEIVV